VALTRLRTPHRKQVEGDPSESLLELIEEPHHHELCEQALQLWIYLPQTGDDLSMPSTSLRELQIWNRDAGTRHDTRVIERLDVIEPYLSVRIRCVLAVHAATKRDPPRSLGRWPCVAKVSVNVGKCALEAGLRGQTPDAV